MAANSDVGLALRREARRSKAGGRRSLALNEADRRFLELCIGETDSEAFCSAESSEGFASLSTTPTSVVSSESEQRQKTEFCLSTDSDEGGSPTSEGGSGKGLDDIMNFKMFSDSDSEEEGDAGQELEDLFSFDLDKVADALRRGANVEELTEIIEEALGDALETRLTNMPDSPASSASGCSFPQALNRTSGLSTPSMTGNLSGMMTPQTTDFQPQGQPAVDVIERRVQEALGGAARKSCSRRMSTAMQHSRIAEAVKSSTAQHRKSLAQACLAAAENCVAEGGSRRRVSVAALRKSLAGACRQHRRSLIMAAEVLEAAGVGVEGSGVPVPVAEAEAEEGERPAAQPEGAADADVVQQLSVVQEAMQTACRRHRQSVVGAVRDLAGAQGKAGRQADRPPRALPCQSVAQEKIQRVIARAYAQRQEKLPGRQREPPGVMDGAPLALMHVHATGPSHRVHCGPVKGCATRRNRSAWRYGSA